VVCRILCHIGTPEIRAAGFGEEDEGDELLAYRSVRGLELSDLFRSHLFQREGECQSVLTIVSAEQVLTGTPWLVRCPACLLAAFAAIHDFPTAAAQLEGWLRE
jgi:hypothetical protein